MNENKIGGVAETMLQTLYARAKESQKTNHKIYDAKAIEIVKHMNYDFSLADKDTAMSTGVIARTIILDKIVKNFIKEYPQTTVINIACGMDTRFYRVDNGKINWYNIDLPITIYLRKKYIKEDNRVSLIACSAMDEKWGQQIKKKFDNILVIIEGLSMYLSEKDVQQILKIIDYNFKNVTVFIEILNPRFVNKNIEKSIQSSGAQFTYGAKNGKEIADLVPSLKWQKDISLVEGMKVITPVYKIIDRIPFIRNLSNKISVLKK